ncbi:hypothetical protein ACFQMA_02150 [Halosimplex aquaticum]|uniref:Uncharacterized protein n=1 Tax=Halosimplex aquaticum TaxID=3026162 RepID=A0ABD5XXB4_9EURY|nr:hypothetical protein [Halosimplex aquaticum]
MENSTGTISADHTENDSDASFTTVDAGTPDETTVWIGPTEAGVLYDGKTWYLNGRARLRDAAKYFAESPRQSISNHVWDVTWEPIGVRTTDEGERVVLNATGLDTDIIAGTEGDPVDVRGTIDVTSEGRIVNGTIAYTVDYGDRTDTRTVTIRTERASGDFVSKPSWVSDPPQVTGDTTDGDKLIELSVTDGPAIEAGTRLSINETFWPTWMGNVTLDERADPGETVYIYRTEENGAATFHASVGERPTLPQNATAFTKGLSVRGRVDNLIFEAGVEIE